MGHLGRRDRPVIKGSARRIGGNACALALPKQWRSFEAIPRGRHGRLKDGAAFGDGNGHFTPGPPLPNAGGHVASQRFV